MRYEVVKNKPDAAFKRLTGVTPKVFKQMLTIVEEAAATGRRPPK